MKVYPLKSFYCSNPGLLNSGTIDIGEWIVICCGGPSSSLQGEQQHAWALCTRCQWHPTSMTISSMTNEGQNYPQLRITDLKFTIPKSSKKFSAMLFVYKYFTCFAHPQIYCNSQKLKHSQGEHFKSMCTIYDLSYETSKSANESC